MLCTRCKKVEAVDGKKRCVACAEYQKIYARNRRLLLKVDKPDSKKSQQKKVNKKIVDKKKLTNEGPVEKINSDVLRTCYFMLQGKVSKLSKENLIPVLIKILEKELK